MATIRIVCPNCQRTGKVPQQALGRNVKCPACGMRYTLAAASRAPILAAADDAAASV
jgi:uncharacterized protein (DUF983 family)